MLKLTYTEFGLHLEKLATPLEVLMAQRVVLALRCGQNLYVESGRASFLLPIDVPELTYLEQAIQTEDYAVVSIAAVDDEFVEVSLQGSWMAQSADAAEGTFVVALSDTVEFYICKLWQLSQCGVSSLI